MSEQICTYCYQKIDPDTCHCGDLIQNHYIDSGHTAVPMGCCCGYHSFRPPPLHLITYIKSLTELETLQLKDFLTDNSVSLNSEMIGNIRNVK